MKVPKIKKKEKKEKTVKKKKISIKNTILIVLISSGIMVASIVLAFVLYVIVTSPDFVPKELYSKQSTTILAKDGKTEIARVGADDIELVTYNDLPEVVIDALIATEDSRFFQHNGFDAARFFKASLGQMAGQNAGGASTLSMQVIKNTFNKNADGTVDSSGIKGIIRKFSDIYMSVFKLEAVYTKEEIIEFYLNSQWLGNGTSYYNGSITGIEQGCQYYFGKSVSDLTLPEASLIVGMFNNPSYYNPYINPEGASERRSTVLNLMVRHGYITEEDKKFAESIDVQSLLIDHSNEETSKYQAFIDFVIAQVENETGDNPRQVPMTIYTTLDTSIQDVLDDFSEGKLWKFPNDTVQYGLAVTSTQDGSVLALSPGRNYVPTGTLRAVGKNNYKPSAGGSGIKRQPGSTAKIIFDYGPYIEYLHGSTGTIFIDRPWTYSNGTTVRNYDYRYVGPITMREALVDSRNIPAVQAFQMVVEQVGADKIADFAHNLGIDYGDNLYESIAIGGVECADPLSMAAAYATFGRGGEYIAPYAFTKVVYVESESVYTHLVEKKRVMSEQTAYLITDMLVTAGSRGVGGNFSISGTQIAAKGGTTTVDKKTADSLGIKTDATPDHWNITYSPDYAIALWYGYDSLGPGKPYLTSATGNPARLNIMKAIAPKIYKKNSKFTKPSGVTSVTIETETYPTQLASPFTPKNFKLTEYYKSGYEPSEVSTRFSQLKNPTNGDYSYDGSFVTISWDPIETPDAINQSYIEEMYNDPYWKFFNKYKQTYYEARLAYNSNSMGVIGYQIYMVDSSTNELKNLGFTTNTEFTYPVGFGSDDYKFIVKSAYSIFKDNMSEGLTISSQSSYDTNINDYSGLTDDDD